MKRVWEYLIVEPFTWIFYCFFQPATFAREFEINSPWKRIVPMLRLAMLAFLVSYPLGIAERFILLKLSLVPNSSITSILFFTSIYILIGIAVGLAQGIAVNIAWGIIISIAGGIAGSIAGSILLGITGSIVGSIAGGIVFSIALGIALDVALGVAVGIALGIVGSVIVGITYGTALGIVGAVIGAAVGGMPGAAAGGIATSIALIIGYVLGYYRLPLYLESGPSGLWTYLASSKNPPRVFTYLHHSSLRWDERIYLPLPYLKQTLLIAAEQNVEDALKEIAFIVAERPQQIHAARAVSLELAMRNLEGCESLVVIAQVADQLSEILPQETKLIAPRWVTPFARIRDASLDAAQYCSPIGKQARRKALEDMVANLQKVYPNTAFGDASLNKRLSKVVDIWLGAARRKLEEIESAPQDIGRIDNPYNPGQVL